MEKYRDLEVSPEGLLVAVCIFGVIVWRLKTFTVWMVAAVALMMFGWFLWDIAKPQRGWHAPLWAKIVFRGSGSLVALSAASTLLVGFRICYL